MIGIAKSNLYYFDDIDISISSILRLIEAYNRNAVLFTPPYKNSVAKISAGKLSIINYNNFEDFNNKMSDKSNLFRSDLIIVNLIGNSLFDLHRFNNYLNTNCNIDYIIFFKTNKKPTKLSIDLTCNIKNKLEDKKNVVYIEYNGYIFTVDSCIISYIRTSKIDSIFDIIDK